MGQRLPFRSNRARIRLALNSGATTDIPSLQLQANGGMDRRECFGALFYLRKLRSNGLAAALFEDAVTLLENYVTADGA